MIGRDSSGDQPHKAALRPPTRGHLKQETPPCSRREQAWTSASKDRPHRPRNTPTVQQPHLSKHQPAIRIQPRDTDVREGNNKPRPTQGSTHNTVNLRRVQQKGPSTFSPGIRKLGTCSQRRTRWHSSDHTLQSNYRSAQKQNTSGPRQAPSAKMNRLFGAKSSAPKPTLNSAISNVSSPFPVRHALPHIPRSTNAFPQSMSNSPP